MNDEVIKNDPEKIKDPKAYLDSFKDSEHYKIAFSAFYDGKNLAPDVTEEEKVEVFENSEAARLSLILYAQDNNKILEYSPDMYSQQFNEKFRDYYYTMRDMVKGNFPNSQEAIIALDDIRSTYHTEAAKELVSQGLAPSVKIARGMIELMIIEKGLESFAGAKTSESEKLRQQIRARTI